MTQQLLVAGGATAILVSVIVAIYMMTRVSRAISRRSEKMRCRRCGSPDVRTSYTSGRLDRFFALFSCAPFRCRACSDRFYRYRRMKENEVTAR